MKTITCERCGSEIEEHIPLSIELGDLIDRGLDLCYECAQIVNNKLEKILDEKANDRPENFRSFYCSIDLTPIFFPHGYKCPFEKRFITDDEKVSSTGKEVHYTITSTGGCPKCGSYWEVHSKGEYPCEISYARCSNPDCSMKWRNK